MAISGEKKNSNKEIHRLDLFLSHSYPYANFILRVYTIGEFGMGKSEGEIFMDWIYMLNYIYKFNS